jgi:transposase-like protein
VSHQTVYNWIEKYTALIEKYLDKITPQVSDTWATDELFLKVKGNLKYLYAMMDEQTRFGITQEVAETKYTADVRPLFQLAKQIAGKTPKTLVSDGAANFHEAYTKEFRTMKLETRTEHIRHIRLQGDFNNNKMERMNGEIRDRERVMRTLEKTDTPILSGLTVRLTGQGLPGSALAAKFRTSELTYCVLPFLLRIHKLHPPCQGDLGNVLLMSGPYLKPI